MSRLRTLLFAAAFPGAFALGAQGAAPKGAADSGDCASCRFRQSADAYHLAAARVGGEWHAYYDAMADYATCMAASLRANTGRCAEPPRQPAGSPCEAPSAQGIAICNATLPPDKPGAEFVAIPEGFKSIDFRQSAYTATGSVRYVWDAMRARAELAPAAANPDREGRRARRRYADSLLAVLAQRAEPPPHEEKVFRAAMDAGIGEMNRAATTDDPEDYINALRFITFADSVHPSPEAKFVLGLITYQIGEHALLAAWQVHSCSVVLLAADAIMQSDRYLSENSVVAPQNAITLRASLVQMRSDATELVTRRCL
jgi:hypothetical protein